MTSARLSPCSPESVARFFNACASSFLVDPIARVQQRPPLYDSASLTFRPLRFIRTPNILRHLRLTHSWIACLEQLCFPLSLLLQPSRQAVLRKYMLFDLDGQPLEGLHAFYLVLAGSDVLLAQKNDCEKR